MEKKETTKKAKGITQREFSAGGVVFKRQNGSGDILWLVTKSTQSALVPKSYWRLPKGRLDDTETDGKLGPKTSGEQRASEDEIKETALREVREEGGVRAEIVNKIETIKYFYRLENISILKFVTFYLMRWESDLVEGFQIDETCETKWVSFDKALKMLEYSGEKGVLKRARKILQV